jgi:hypothetical protein
MSTYTPIASQTLGSAASSITFTNIPQNFTDLIFTISYIQNSSTVLTYVRYRFNSDTGSNYSITAVQDGSPALTFGASNQTSLEVGYQAAAGSSQFISHINNYSNATTNKTVLTRHANAGALTQALVGLWRNTSAINSINILCDAGSFAAGSTFNLYGIANASASTGKASGGNIVTTDGTYWYHTFTSSGTFTPLQALTVDYLVVGGGGGGGGGTSTDYGSGGAGGTCRTGSNFNVSSAATVTIGSGGSASGNGTSSVFSSITATAGNGSGQTSKTGGANADFSGATGAGNGGGGGAGSGANASSSSGGAGATSSITGTSVNYGGGGSGTGRGGATVAGGAGGGGFGNIPGANGTANTGGGGGGSQLNANTNGGSGLVIVRYLV